MEQLGIPFTVWIADVEELESGPPEQVAAENARRKAAAVAAEDARRNAAAVAAGTSGALVLGVDTVVALGSVIYGKPADVSAARATLAALSGSRHAVISGVCLISDSGERTALATTIVEFRELPQALIGWYLDTGEWLGRAGGYAIQGRGAALVRRIEGDYLNVVGLPVASLLALAPELLDG